MRSNLKAHLQQLGRIQLEAVGDGVQRTRQCARVAAEQRWLLSGWGGGLDATVFASP